MLFSIISGSKRHLLLAELLSKDGHEVALYRNYDELPEKVGGKIIILPIPTLNKDGAFNIEGNDSRITADEVIARTDNDALIISCNYSTGIRRFTDINKYEAFTSMNAVPSAEGAIFEAMKNSGTTLFGSRSLVIGYGRIGKLIADRMKSFGAHVSVTARNPKDIYFAKASGIETVGYSDLKKAIGSFDVIFQTVPNLILTREMLDLTNAVIIELASKGAGTDLEYAAKKNMKVVYAPGIPEKYSPVSAGKIFYDSVINILNESDI